MIPAAQRDPADRMIASAAMPAESESRFQPGQARADS
jgi:hypothetical protein